MRHPASESCDTGEDTNDRCDHCQCGGVASDYVLAVPSRAQHRDQGGSEHRQNHLLSDHNRVSLSVYTSVQHRGEHARHDCDPFYHIHCCHHRHRHHCRSAEAGRSPGDTAPAAVLHQTSARWRLSRCSSSFL